MKPKILLFKILLSILVIIIPTVASTQNCTSLDTINWILGEWQHENEKILATEIWIKLSPNTYDGIAQTLSKKEDKITFVEALRIVEMTDEVFYVAKVSHNEYPISFKLIDCSDSTAVFENNTHDFPKKIFYQLSDGGRSLSVTVSNEKLHFNVEYKKN